MTPPDYNAEANAHVESEGERARRCCVGCGQAWERTQVHAHYAFLAGTRAADAAAYRRGVEDAALWTEDYRYTLQGREAEWCRFIAMGIRRALLSKEKP